jgi:hypothetical protein
MMTKTMYEQAEQLVAYEDWDAAEVRLGDSLSGMEQVAFGAGWDAGVAWARLTEQRRLADCEHITPCQSAEVCWSTTEEARPGS